MSVTLPFVAVEFGPHSISRIEIRQFNSKGLSGLGVHLHITVKHSTEMPLLSRDHTVSGT